MSDRTLEFQRIVQDLTLNADPAALRKASIQKAQKNKSAFNDAAADIAKGVHRTSTLLGKLTNLVRKQGLYDDPTEEINQLIFRIKQDLDALNTQCDTAQQFLETGKSFFSTETANQASQHNAKVVSQLKGDLMSTTKDFKSVLELRSSKMKDQQQRKLELTGKGILSPLRAIEASNTGLVQRHKGPLPTPYTFSNNNNNNTNLPRDPYSSFQNNSSSSSSKTAGVEAVEEGGWSAQQQETQQLLLEPLSASNIYYESREQAVTEVEKTIGELGSLFTRLATMLAAQQELVERIDEDVETATENTNNARNALLKAYEKVSSNRGLYLKVGAILAIFFLLFVLFLM